MKKNCAFLFPGQGSQAVGMGKNLYENSETAKNIFDRANEVLKTDIKKLCFEGPEEELKITINTQPAITVTSIAALEVIKKQNLEPSIVAGHSLGEYTALYAAGALDFENVLKTVKTRGNLMNLKDTGSMAAVIGLDESTVKKYCDQTAGRVVIANYNAPDQLVISGDKEAIQNICEELKKAGARRVVPLAVSGAFHSPLFKDVAREFENYLTGLDIAPAKVPIVMNVTAQPVSEATMIKKNISVQILSPVRWTESIKKIKEAGINTFVEVGPGKVLTGLVKRILPDITTFNFSSLSDLPAIESLCREPRG